MPAATTGVFKGQRHAKDTQRGNPKGNGKDTKTEQMEIVPNGPQKSEFAGRFVQLRARLKQNREKGKEKIPQSTFNETRRHSKGDGKGDT